MMVLQRLVNEFLVDESGATAVEYGLLAGLIVVAVIGGLAGLGNDLGGSFNDTADSYPS